MRFGCERTRFGADGCRWVAALLANATPSGVRADLRQMSITRSFGTLATPLGPPTLAKVIPPLT
jgi:hypothetical protein